MACISKYFQGPQILCFAHLLHFSVTKTFFSNYKIIENNNKKKLNNEESDDDYLSDEDNEKDIKKKKIM